MPERPQMHNFLVFLALLRHISDEKKSSVPLAICFQGQGGGHCGEEGQEGEEEGEEGGGGWFCCTANRQKNAYFLSKEQMPCKRREKRDSGTKHKNG